MYAGKATFVSLLALYASTSAMMCPCGWRIPNTSELFTHRIHHDFSQFPDIEDLVHDPRAQPFTRNWFIYDYEDKSPNLTIRLNAKYEAQNLQIRGGHLQLRQRAYTAVDRQLSRPISASGIQTKEVDILHGSFRVQMKIEGATGGACGSFFWYHDNDAEIDIEAVTQGTSLVNNTINYTMHPSLDLNGNPINNATLSVPMEGDSHTINTMNEHRFDCSVKEGVTYFLDDQIQHRNYHNIPKVGGNLQLKLWADGNQWWSGVPSTTDVTLSVASITAFFNTTQSDQGADVEWQRKCEKAGGPNAFTVCDTRQTTSSTNAEVSSAIAHLTTPTDARKWLFRSCRSLIYLWPLLLFA